ncbi:MAG: hypothetical protein V1495_08865 [Pseudomonadota bacterium]
MTRQTFRSILLLSILSLSVKVYATDCRLLKPGEQVKSAFVTLHTIQGDIGVTVTVPDLNETIGNCSFGRGGMMAGNKQTYHFTEAPFPTVKIQPWVNEILGSATQVVTYTDVTVDVSTSPSVPSLLFSGPSKKVLGLQVESVSGVSGHGVIGLTPGVQANSADASAWVSYGTFSANHYELRN